MSYTHKDLDNSITYSNNRYLLRIISKLYQTMPHLITHMEYSIQQADPTSDYYYPPAFAARAIKVTTKIPEYLCDKISCNAVKENDVCKRDTIASYYIVGDTSNFKRQCEPSCFHLRKDPIIDEETGEEQTQMVRLKYTNNYGCVIMPTASSWHEHPFYRSETVYEHRLNDLPAGFNEAPPDPYSYSGMTYEYNKTYCDAFYDQWSSTKKKCIKKWWETVLYAVVGESIVKMVKAGIQNAENGYKSDYPPVSFPPIPDIESEWTVLGWSKDINDSFIVPPVEYEIPQNTVSRHIQREISDNNHTAIEESDYIKNINFIKQLKSKQKQISVNLRRKIEEFYDVKLNSEEHKEITRVKELNKNNKPLNVKDIILKNKKTGEESDVGEIILSIINSLLSSVFDPAFWADIGIGLVSDVILDQIKVVFRKLANDIIPKLTTKILGISGKLLSKVFANSIISTITNTMSKIVVKTISKVMIQLAKLAAEIASVVGIILAILTVFDILLTIWDPLGFNNKFDQKVINSVTRSSDIAMRQSLGMSVPAMSFELFSNMTLTPEEIIEESLSNFKYIYEYLDALTVNSEGSRIDKGNEIDFNDSDIDGVADQAIADTKLITPKELYDYEQDHKYRMEFYKRAATISTSLIAIGCLLMFVDMWILALIIFMIVLIVLSTSYINSSTINIGKLIKNTLEFRIW
ncbi:PIF-0 [Carcinus maenas nudivirus]|uniref:PIF-0 n=1 Tax=Carcinus maenas nudivirus TaxID=2880837 RepID=A0AAE8Y0F5_9VIRU|nr:PIF-0 [Carcinus maenas nudivirus]UBZ25654.1 PIF-0 [Carcinus maenas nudivirus]